MESLKKNKKLVIAFIIAFVAFSGYQFKGVFVADSEIVNVDTTLSFNILNSLSEMQRAKIDNELFNSTAWTKLVDYSIILPSDAPGRPDLFGNTFQPTERTTTSSTTTQR